MSQCSVFISHPPQEEAAVARLRAELAKLHIVVAPRRHEVPAGLRWKPALKTAMAASVRFLACFSARDGGLTSFVEDELAMAIEHARTLPLDQPWLIPVKLTACEIPAQLADTEQFLDGIDAIDLSADWDGGIARILGGLDAGHVHRPHIQTTQEECPVIPGGSPHETSTKAESALIGGNLTIDGVSLTGTSVRPTSSAKMTTELGRLVVDGDVSITNVKRKP